MVDELRWVHWPHLGHNAPDGRSAQHRQHDFYLGCSLMRENYGPPHVGAAIVWDSLSWLELVERIRGLANLRDATIIVGHDPRQIKEIRLAPEAYYD